MSLRLIVIRHGKASPDSPSGLDDHRELTPRGRRQAEHLGLALRPWLSGTPVLVSSPIVRASQTAEIVGAALGLPIHLDHRLATGRTVRDAIETIEDMCPGHGTVLLVGHNPHFEQLVYDLTPPGSAGELKTGTACVLASALPLRLREAALLATVRLEDG